MIEKVVGNYSKKFTLDNLSCEQYNEVLRHVRSTISARFNEDLMRPYTKDEIYSALSQMHPCKARGPTGMHAIF